VSHNLSVADEYITASLLQYKEKSKQAIVMDLQGEEAGSWHAPKLAMMRVI